MRNHQIGKHHFRNLVCVRFSPSPALALSLSLHGGIHWFHVTCVMKLLTIRQFFLFILGEYINKGVGDLRYRWEIQVNGKRSNVLLSSRFVEEG
jgi:hypothetical protein